MKIAVDISPIKKQQLNAHKVRGVGFYIENLIANIKEVDKKNDYVFFTRDEKLPKNVSLVHYPYFEPFFFSLPAIRSQKTVVTVHDLIPLVLPKYFPVGIKGKLKWAYNKKLLKSVNAIITDSQSSKNDIQKLVGIASKKIHVVPLAASLDFKSFDKNKKDIEKKRILEKYRIPSDFVLYVGDITRNKNLPRLLDACIEASVPLVLVGKAITDTAYDKKNPWNIDIALVQDLFNKHKKIYPLGFVANDDLVALYNSAKLFILPSLYEGFGLPILEAMQCGCPVITTKQGSLKEVAGEAAFYTDPYSTTSIQNGIETVFNSTKLRDELIKKGFLQAKKFSWKNTAEATIAVYDMFSS